MLPAWDKQGFQEKVEEQVEEQVEEDFEEEVFQEEGDGSEHAEPLHSQLLAASVGQRGDLCGEKASACTHQAAVPVHAAQPGQPEEG